MRIPALSVLALGLLGPSLVAQEPGAWLRDLGTHAEPRTEIPFARYRELPGSEEPQLLAGTGLYTKTFLAIKIYAFGFYVEPEGAARALERWAGTPARQRARSAAFYQDFWAGDFAKSVRWVMCRDVGGEDVAEAFDDVLGPRLARLARTASAEENRRASTALAAFRGYFEGEITRGMELVFTWQPGGRLVTWIDGEVAGELVSDSLCRALFACYLDEDPLDDDAKEGFAGCVEDVVRAARAEAEERRSAAAFRAPAESKAGG